MPGLLSEANGATHQAIEDIGLMRLVPGVEIFCPADEDELVEGLPHAIASPAPTYVRFVTTRPRYAHQPFTWGRAEVVGDGRDVALVAAGYLAGEAWDAVERLHQVGIAARLVNLRTLVPLDEDAVLAAAREARLLVTVEDHLPTGGVYTAVTELLGRAGLAGRVISLALPGVYRAAPLADALQETGFTGDLLAARVARELGA